MTTFYIPNALNPRSWTCGDVIEDHVNTFEDLRFIVALLANLADDDTQKVIVQILSPGLEARK
jgi:predicted DNA-binding protein